VKLVYYTGMTAREFRVIRAFLGLSQAALGEKIGRTSVQVGAYENEKATVPKAVAMALKWLESQERV